MSVIKQVSRLLLVSVVILTACHQKTETPTSSSSKASSSTSTVASSSVASSSSSSSTVQPLWTEEKTKQLNTYILETWGPSLGQVYKAYTPATQGNWYGTAIPDQILEVPAGGLTLDFAGQTPDLVWSNDGLTPAGQLGVVAVYADIDHVTNILHMPAGAHLYVFTIDATGAGQVWISQQNQGNEERRFYFTETKNEELRNFYTQLVGNGVVAAPVTQTESGVDTKNLTIEQSANWAAAHAAKGYGNPYTKADFSAMVTGIDRSPDGLVYVEVRENHNSANMRAAGADPNVSPLAGFYRINASGQLELKDIVSNTYKVVETVYYE